MHLDYLFSQTSGKVETYLPHTKRDIMESEPKTKTFAEMLAYAKTIHPDATIRLEDSCDTWQIVIETDISQSWQVDETWKGTPAEEAYNTPDSGGEDVLNRWARKNGHGSEPLALVAEQYNINHDSQVWAQTRLDELLVEAGHLPMLEMIAGREITHEDFVIYNGFRTAVGEMMTVQFAARQEALNLKLGHISY